MAKLYSAWKYRADIEIENPSSDEGFQAKITLNFLPGMRFDFRDIRFASVTGQALSYWIESHTDFTSAVLWVALPANDKKIRLYYGNGYAVSESSGEDVFLEFDDFSTDTTGNYTVRNLGGSKTLSYDSANKRMKITNTGSGYCAIVKSVSNLPSSYIEEHSICIESGVFTSAGALHFNSSKSGNIIVMVHAHSSGDSIRIDRWGPYSAGNAVSHTLVAGNTYAIKNINNAGTLTVYIDETETATRALGFTTNTEMGFGAYDGNVYVDNYKIRHYTATEPTLTFSRKSSNPDFYTSFESGPAPTILTADAISQSVASAVVPGDDITADAISHSTAGALFTAGTIALTEVMSQSVAITNRHDHIPTAVISKSVPGNFPLKGFIQLNNYNVESVDISRTVSDSMWQLTAQIESTKIPREFMHVNYVATDADGTNQNLFTGLIPDSKFVLQVAANKSSITAYDYGFYLSKQKVNYAELAMNLQGNYTTWDAWIIHLLENTGIIAYKINSCAAADKEIKINATSSKLDAIKKIAEYAGFIFYVAWVNIGTEENPVLQPSAYFVDVDDIDDPSNGLDLPAAETLTWPDSSLVGIPSMQSIIDEDYNRVIVRGMDTSGTWYTAIAETAAVTAGDEYAREYYEESGDWNTQAKADARAAALLSYFTTKIYKVQATFIKRYDLKLWQKIKFEGSGFPVSLIGMSWLRIISIQYHNALADETVTIGAIADRDMDLQVSRIDAVLGDGVSETELMIDSALGEMRQMEIGTVTAISDDGETCTIETESGNTITARVIQ